MFYWGSCFSIFSFLCSIVSTAICYFYSLSLYHLRNTGLDYHLDSCQLFVRLTWFMISNATLNNISVISWRSTIFVEETGVSGENHRPDESHWQTLSHNVLSSIPHLSGIYTDNVGSYMSN